MYMLVPRLKGVRNLLVQSEPHASTCAVFSACVLCGSTAYNGFSDTAAARDCATFEYRVVHVDVSLRTKAGTCFLPLSLSDASRNTVIPQECEPVAHHVPPSLTLSCCFTAPLRPSFRSHGRLVYLATLAGGYGAGEGVREAPF